MSCRPSQALKILRVTFADVEPPFRSYFAAYEATIQYVCKTQNITRDQVSPLWAVGSGCVAGYALWASVYPIDVVKSKIQSGSGNYTGMMDCFRKTWANQGVKGFTNGLTPTLVRSPFGKSFSHRLCVPANAICSLPVPNSQWSHIPLFRVDHACDAMSTG